MRLIKIIIHNCTDCPNADPPTKHGKGLCMLQSTKMFKTYKENKEYITETCPLWDKSIEV